MILNSNKFNGTQHASIDEIIHEYDLSGSHLVKRKYEFRAYASGDESLPDTITDGTNTVTKRVTPITETVTNPTLYGIWKLDANNNLYFDGDTVDDIPNPQIVDATEEFIDAEVTAGNRDVSMPCGGNREYYIGDNSGLDLSIEYTNGYTNNRYITAGQLVGSTLGTRATAEGEDVVSSGNCSHAEGFHTSANGAVSHAEGGYTTAYYLYSHAEGNLTYAFGESSHAEGSGNKAIGVSSHAEGNMTTANSSCSHTEGNITYASGNSSHAEGNFTSAYGNYSHAEGSHTYGAAAYAHSEGYQTYANAGCSHAEGQGTSAMGWPTHAEGQETIATMHCSHAEGYQTTADGDYGSHAEGYKTCAYGNSSHVEGNFTKATGNYSHAEGYSSHAKGNNSHAEGNSTTSYGVGSHAEGMSTSAYGTYSHAEGSYTCAKGSDSHAEGSYTYANGSNSHAEGQHTIAEDYSHAEGLRTTSFGSYGSHSEGWYTYASGDSAHAGGQYTTASNTASFSTGHYNASMTTGGSVLNTDGTAFVIGNGTVAGLPGTPTLKNAFSVQFNGVVKAASTITASTTADYAEYFEWSDGNKNNEDRIGYFITLDNEDKIKIANSEDEYILGISSGEPFVLGNGDCDVWNGMVMRDEFRRVIYEPAPLYELNEETGEYEPVLDNEGNQVYQGTRPVYNLEYDPTRPYINRADRPEWCPVGMLGVLAVRDDGTCEVNGYCKVAEGGIATKATLLDIGNKYRVVKRKTDNVIEVIFR